MGTNENSSAVRARPTGPVFGPYWSFYSFKAGQVVRVRGDLRYYFSVLLEVDPLFERVSYPELGARRVGQRLSGAAEFDFLAFDTRGRGYAFCVLDHSHARSTGSFKRGLRRIDELVKAALSRELGFAVVTDALVFRDTNSLANWAHVLRYLARSRALVNETLCSRILSYVQSKRSSNLLEVEAEFIEASTDQITTNVLHCLRLGELNAEMSRAPLGRTTKIWSEIHGVREETSRRLGITLP